MIGAGLGLLSSVMGIISSANANARTRRQIDELAAKQKMPAAIGQGEAIMRDLATKGLPGYQNQLSEINESVPMTINQMRDFITSGGAIEMANKLWSGRNKAVNQLQSADDAARVQNRQQLADYLSRVVAPAQSRLQDDINSLAMARMGTNQAQTQDLLNFVNTGLNAVGNDKGLYKWLGTKLGYDTDDDKDDSGSKPFVPKSAVSQTKINFTPPAWWDKI